MKINALLLLAAAIPLSASAGNFCAVTAMGANCNFPDLQSCYQHLQGLGGQCVVNPQALPQPAVQAAPGTPQVMPMPQLQHPDVMGSVIRAGQAGRAARQREAIPAQRPMTNDGYWVMYKCPTPTGEMEFTGTPAPGCIVEHVTAY